METLDRQVAVANAISELRDAIKTALKVNDNPLIAFLNRHFGYRPNSAITVRTVLSFWPEQSEYKRIVRGLLPHIARVIVMIDSGNVVIIAKIPRT